MTKKGIIVHAAPMAVFKGRQVRRTVLGDEWWFSVVDVVAALTDSVNPRDYWFKMKIREKDEAGVELSTICRQLKLPAPDGKLRETDCANTEGILLYKLKGYSDDWIEKRMRGIAIREELTDEWQKRGAAEEKDYEILTAEISKAAFGVTPTEYKAIKGLKRENLRDHMDDFELIFTMLGERSTTEIHRQEESQGIPKLKADAHAGGRIAGDARKALEKRLKRPIVSSQNYLREKEAQKRLKA